MAALVCLDGRTSMPQTDSGRAVWNVVFLASAALFAWELRSLEEVAADSQKWNHVVFPNLGAFSGLASVFILFILPGIPFLVAAWSTLRTAKFHSVSYRVGISVLVFVLAIVSFRDIAWLFWFAVTVLHGGGAL